VHSLWNAHNGDVTVAGLWFNDFSSTTTPQEFCDAMVFLLLVGHRVLLIPLTAQVRKKLQVMHKFLADEKTTHRRLPSADFSARRADAAEGSPDRDVVADLE
jgi:hypothetical protein